MKRFLGALFGLLLLSGVAQAELIVCGDATALRTFYPSLDPTRLSPFPADCAVVSKADTASQRALLEGGVVPLRHIKVVNARAVEMTQPEKNAVDAQIVLQQAALQLFKDELIQQDVCSKGLFADLQAVLDTRKANRQDQITTARNNLQTDIDALATANLATLKAGLTQVNATYYNITTGLLTEQYTLIEKLARCLLAFRKAR